MKKVLLVTGSLILILIVVLMLSLGHIIKAGVNTMGPRLAGVPVKLDAAIVNPLTGMVRIKGLIIGNPEGFNTPSVMELNDFKLKIKMSSLFSKAIVIEEILISEPQITYEKGLKSSNLSKLQENLASKEESAKTAPAPEKKKGAAKKVIIDDFQLNRAKVNVTITALGGKKLTLPLPPIHLQDVGRKSDGASPAEVISEVFGSISKAVVDVVASAGDLTGDVLKDAGSAAGGALKSTGGAATDAAKSATEGIKKGFGGLLGK